MKIEIPELALVLLIGPSGAGKSRFARDHFLPTEVISSDDCRAWVSDDPTDQSATEDAFDLLTTIARKRLARGKLTVIDATNVQPEARKPLIELARSYHVLPVAIVLDMPVSLCLRRNQLREDRSLGPHVVRNQHNQLHRSLRGLKREGFRYIHHLTSPEAVESLSITRQRLWVNRRDDAGPFDIIGDVHGCFDELHALLDALGYQVTRHDEEGEPRFEVQPPAGRRAIFVGDLVDRGPDSPNVLRLVMEMVEAGTALCVPGNHDIKLLRALQGRRVKIAHGLSQTLDQLQGESVAFRKRLIAFLDGLISHYVFDEGKLVVAHAGLSEALQGRASRWVRDFALYGDTTGELDEFGLPVRRDWAARYRGEALVVYGHTPVAEPRWLNHTVNIDTGAVFGGALSALRYPEQAVVSVAALRQYAVPPRPLSGDADLLSAQQQDDSLLDLSEVTGKRRIETELQGTVTIRAENAAAALEVMSRFAVDPRWLIYLPPTMSPSKTSQREGLLEHPDEAFAYYANAGVTEVVCQEKHMGSRAIVIVGRSEAAIQQRFGLPEAAIGICYTRTGRRFFDEPALERAFLHRLQAAVGAAGWWDQFESEWLLLDCELMPWSAKAQGMIREQYAAVGAAARTALPTAVAALQTAQARGQDVAELRRRFDAQQGMIEAFSAAYRRYAWPVEGVDDLRLAPFHLLATEGVLHSDKSHLWQMESLSELTRQPDPLLHPTAYRLVDLTDDGARAEAVAWWEALTDAGGEGMVVKPMPFIARGRRSMIQPAVKCRGRDYLRLIYGPTYTEPANLARLRQRGLGRKSALALREFALGMEGLARWIRREPLRRTHECIFGVLALESEPVDPRL
ncbi:MAG: polynucleotide kinase-phosphatase [Ardenticatenales bacterium]|nr:polynucleotide kinase-phosphatase [Ardenticatenales bacterium]